MGRRSRCALWTCLTAASEDMWTISIGVSQSEASEMARYVASVSAICGRAVAWNSGAVCPLPIKRLEILKTGCQWIGSGCEGTEHYISIISEFSQ